MHTYSLEHQGYLKKKRIEFIIVHFFRIIIVILFFFLWEVLSSNNIINSFIFSSPLKIINTIRELLIKGELIKHIITTINEILISFIVSSILGIIISIVLWSNKLLSRIIDPFITIINSLPKVALGPLIIIWIGANNNSIIFMALMINLFVTIIGIYNGFISINENYIIMIKSFGARKYQIFNKIVFPSSISSIINTLKINISMSLIGVIMGELLVSKCGIGYLIMYGSQVFNIDLVLSSIFILGIVSFLMYYFVEIIERLIKKKYKC